jgi:uncharacterized protein (UPF0210 family)
MEIRSVTAFIDSIYPVDSEAISKAGRLAAEVRSSLEISGWKVQTSRLALQHISQAVGSGDAVNYACAIESSALEAGLNYISLGPVITTDPSKWFDEIPAILAATSSVFMSAEIASGHQVRTERLKQLARCIQKISTVSADGFANLKFAALANVKPWSPFFPAAYHGGGQPVISIATESADLAQEQIVASRSIEQARTNLLSAIEESAGEIEATVRPIIEKAGARFEGIDFSLAPYPSEMRSIGKALEALGLSSVGQAGTLLLSAWLTGILQEAKFTRTGFCGLMLPVLEDTTLAARAAEDRLTVIGLLAYSAVCGTGLDTIPLPGNIS